jgi:hypothetical protein
MKRTSLHLAVAAALLLWSVGTAQAQLHGTCSSCGGGTGSFGAFSDGNNGAAGAAGFSGGTYLDYYNQSPMGGTTQLMSPVCLPSGKQYPRPWHAAQYALHDHYSPHPYYAYSQNGVLAGRTNDWNVSQMQLGPWHGGYSYWRWQQPTALVVPPTAAFQSEYNWGVGQTRSIPIYHQYGSAGAGTIPAGGSGFGFPPTPYWPSSTSQFGIYPVRGPWH